MALPSENGTPPLPARREDEPSSWKNLRECVVLEATLSLGLGGGSGVVIGKTRARDDSERNGEVQKGGGKGGTVLAGAVKKDERVLVLGGGGLDEWGGVRGGGWHGGVVRAGGG
jgi:hypothetical protein